MLCYCFIKRKINNKGRVRVLNNRVMEVFEVGFSQSDRCGMLNIEMSCGTNKGLYCPFHSGAGTVSWKLSFAVLPMCGGEGNQH